MDRIVIVSYLMASFLCNCLFICDPLHAKAKDIDVPETKSQQIWAPLIQKLITDGEDPVLITSLFHRPDVRFDPRVMPRKLSHKETSLVYEKFMKPDRLNRAKKFLQDNYVLLDKIERQYGVPKEIKVAILLVETDLGRYLGSGSAFNILASMAAASSIDQVRPWLSKELIASYGEKWVETRLRKKSAWAYTELKSLIFYSQLNQMDPVAIKGSIFGAIGLCQFMPSNVLRYGIDYDKDGKIDLFKKSDALASIANYLRAHGWRQGLNEEQRMKVILSYNHSRPYATTILKVAKTLSCNLALDDKLRP